MTRRRRLAAGARRFFGSALVAYLLMFSLFFVGLETAYLRNCNATQRNWNALDRVIAAATHPPSRTGTTISPDQRRALDRYSGVLRDALGERPSCRII